MLRSVLIIAVAAFTLTACETDSTKIKDKNGGNGGGNNQKPTACGTGAPKFDLPAGNTFKTEPFVNDKGVTITTVAYFGNSFINFNHQCKAKNKDLVKVSFDAGYSLDETNKRLNILETVEKSVVVDGVSCGLKVAKAALSYAKEGNCLVLTGSENTKTYFILAN